MTVNELQQDPVKMLRDARIKVTKIRIAILDLLSAERRHMTADEITAALKKAGVPADRVTVYRNLDRMIHEGLLIATCQPGKAMRVGACMRPSAPHHHHIICERCGRVAETDGCPVQDVWDELKRQVRASTDFTLAGHITQYLGICPNCAPAGSPD
jgi:Fur family ferric uptake transcriptional regulator